MSTAPTLTAARRLGGIFETVTSLVRSGRPLHDWPARPGRYRIGDPSGSIAVCTLTSNHLIRSLSGLPGVAIAGGVYTPNLGLERIVNAIGANPRIRTLFVCGRESPVFRPGQALAALAAHGLDEDGSISGADGLLAALPVESASRVDAFREQVEVVEAIGLTDPAELAARIAAIPRLDPVASGHRFVDPQESFAELRPGGHREPLQHDPKGFFVISLDAGSITVHHYLSDRRPAHVVRSRSGESVLLGLLREGLVSQLSHAGYLGAELAKAETALRLGLRYEQDQPLRT